MKSEGDEQQERTTTSPTGTMETAVIGVKKKNEVAIHTPALYVASYKMY